MHIDGPNTLPIRQRQGMAQFSNHEGKIYGSRWQLNIMGRSDWAHKLSLDRPLMLQFMYEQFIYHRSSYNASSPSILVQWCVLTLTYSLLVQHRQETLSDHEPRNQNWHRIYCADSCQGIYVETEIFSRAMKCTILLQHRHMHIMRLFKHHIFENMLNKNWKAVLEVHTHNVIFASLMDWERNRGSNMCKNWKMRQNWNCLALLLIRKKKKLLITI